MTEAPGEDRADQARDVELHCLAGIDEAGLGPILGPLVVAGLVLQGPAGLSPWKHLQSLFCKKPRSRRDRRIRVDDSKRVKTGKTGLAEIERTALTLHSAATGRLAENLDELLDLGVGPGPSGRESYAWYRELKQRTLPRWNDRRTIELDAHNVARGFEKAGLRPLAFVFHPVLVGTFNDLITKHDNKSLAHYEASLPVLRAAVAARPEDTAMKIVIDRHGGREHYASLLERSFPGRRVRIVRETPVTSEYDLDESCRLVFTERGEEKAFPTAAASCMAKYVRELLVDRINVFFRARLPAVRPTAGYYKDGRRFLEDVREVARELPARLLVRSR